MTHDIFLSYKREDETLATRLAKALEAEGFSVWWDRSLLPAESWREQIQAALDGAPPPKSKGPVQRTMRRASTGVPSLASLDAVAAFTGNVAPVQQHVCSVDIVQPNISDVCGSLGLGAKQSKDEPAAWAAIPSGSCNALRTHVEHFPEGAYRSAAADMIAARRVMQEEVWSPSEKTLRMFKSTDAKLAPSEAEACEVADARAVEEASNLCAGFASTLSYRLSASLPSVETWDCEAYSEGHDCSGRGEALCSVEVRAIVETELCGFAR